MKKKREGGRKGLADWQITILAVVIAAGAVALTIMGLRSCQAINPAPAKIRHDASDRLAARRVAETFVVPTRISSWRFGDLTAGEGDHGTAVMADEAAYFVGLRPWRVYAVNPAAVALSPTAMPAPAGVDAGAVRRACRESSPPGGGR